jgi:hypothetical protein
MRQGVLEFRRAMFWAACVAQCAEEPFVSGNRIVSALLRAPSVRSRLQDEIADPDTPSFEECERRVLQDLAARGVELGSKEHQALVARRPLEPAVKTVFDTLLDQQFLVTPHEVLLALIEGVPAVAERLARGGLTAEKIR